MDASSKAELQRKKNIKIQVSKQPSFTFYYLINNMIVLSAVNNQKSRTMRHYSQTVPSHHGPGLIIQSMLPSKAQLSTQQIVISPSPKFQNLQLSSRVHRPTSLSSAIQKPFSVFHLDDKLVKRECGRALFNHTKTRQ